MISRPARGGCALGLGLLLIGTGSLLLATNLLDLSLAHLWGRALTLFGLYWPVLLILWGAVKVYQRVAQPAAARVTAGEIFLVIFLALAGLGVRSAQRMAGSLSLDEIIEVFAPEAFYGPAYRFSEEHRFNLPEGASLNVENARGSLSATGWEESDLKVVLTKRVYRHSESEAARLAERIRLSFETRAGGLSRLAIERPRDEELAQVETDFEIWLPRKTPLTLANAYGRVSVSGLRAALGLAGAYDSIEVRDVEGSVNAEGRHGPLRIENVRGDVAARSRYGNLTVRELEGNLIGEASNGELLVEQVSGSARLSNRHSHIRAEGVGGDLTVEATNTEVSVEQALAAVSITTSYRPVFVQGVAGRLTIDSRNSEIEVRDVKGHLDLRNVYRPVTVTRVEGGAVVDARQCAVRMEEVAGPIRVAGSYHPVEIRGFQSSLSVDTEHAAVTLAPALLGGELRVATTYGAVELALPPESSFRLRARTRGGNIRCDFVDPSWTRREEGEEEELQGAAGRGAIPISIETTYANIEIRKTLVEAEQR